MIQRSIVVAEEWEKGTQKDDRRGKAVRQVASEVSHFLQEDLHVLEGGPAQDILKTVHSWPRPEMVILGTQGARGLEQFLEGSVAEKVILHSQRPVLVLGPRAQEKFQGLRYHKPRRILVSTDLTRLCRPAEQYAMSLAARLNAELVLFHSVYDQIKRTQEASILSGFANFDLEKMWQKMTRDALSLLEKKQKHLQKIVGRCEIKMGERGMAITEALLNESTMNYCMVVMGTHSRRNALLRAFLGSSAREMILRADLPVVVVHGR